MNKNDFQGKTALITGASRGIGAATAEEFAARGANVIINYKTSRDRAETLAQDLATKYHIQTLAVQADVSRDDDVQKMREIITQNFAKLDILVNNAGFVVDKPFDQHARADFEQIFATNVWGVLNCGKIFGEMIRAAGGGCDG